MNIINPEVHEMQQQFSEMRDRMSKFEGQVEELRRVVTETSRQPVWQLIVFTLTIAAVVPGGLKFQTDALRNESNAKFDAIERRIEQAEKNTNLRIEQSDRNISIRFEDLKQVVLSQRKQTSGTEAAPK